MRVGLLRALVPLAPLIAAWTIFAGLDQGADPIALHAVGDQSASGLPLGPMPQRHDPAYPLRVSASHRYLEDSEGQPFLIKGDAAWSLIAELKRDDVAYYLRDRRSRGFNTLLVSLIEHHFATNAPANAYGDAPFLAPGQFDRPNEAYFAYADWVVRRAEAEGFLVLLTPCYTGAGGGAEGWYEEMEDSGAEKLRAYGRYVGRRYAKFKNIIWVANGDFDAPDKDLVRAVIDGIRDTDPLALFTSHNENGTPALDYWPGETWLQVNNVYTWGPVYPLARAQYLREPAVPYFLVESQYENAPDITTQRLRSQAYQALLTGAAGHVFGNSPIWYFDGSDEYPAPPGWRRALDGAGSRSMARLHELFARLPWTQFEPDVSTKLLIDGQGEGVERAVAARSRDGSMAMIYIPDDRTVTLNLAGLKGSGVRAFWYDPSSGRTYKPMGAKLRTDGIETFRPLKQNASGFSDWLLVLRAEGPLNPAAPAQAARRPGALR
jgi:Protein of unknown function (DUF4038)/Putative collagen-binding domain of a collagenase